MSAWTVIGHQELSSDQASITFSSIPGTYTDLAILASTRDVSSSAPVANLIARFNGTTTGYSDRFLFGAQAFGVGSGSSTTRSGAFIGHTQSFDNTANTYSNNFAYIPNYASSNHKSWSADGTPENNGVIYQFIIAGLWANTAAITSMTIRAEGDQNLRQYTSITLYGITRGSSGGVTVS